MPVLDSSSDTDSASLSALSEVDESFLNIAEKSSENPAKKVAGRPKTSKTNGVDARDKTHGRTALHKAAARGNLQKMKELIEIKHATIDITDNAGVTPLHDACTGGHAKAVQYLVAAGANVSPKDCEGDYPLLDAAQNDNEEICQILLDAGANPTMQNSSGMSALSEAEEGSLKDLLRHYSSRFHSPGQNRMKINDVLTVDKVASPDATGKDSARLRATRTGRASMDLHGARKVDIHGRDQLHQYVLDDEDELVEQFLEIQDADNQDHYGDTPLHAASRAGNAHICGLLLQHDANVDLTNKKGNTALHEAAYTPKNREVMVALLDAGSSSLVQNNENQLPADIAAAQLGANSVEARLLRKTLINERKKAEDKERKRAARIERNGSVSDSAKSTPLHSPRVIRDTNSPNATPVPAQANTNSAHNKRPTDKESTPVQQLPLPPQESPAEVAVTVATTAPPEIVTTTKQVVASGLPTTQFLTELKSNRFLSHIDSSVRGSPLPVPPKTHHRASSQPVTQETSDVSARNQVSPNALKRKSLNGDASTQKRSRSESHAATNQSNIGHTHQDSQDTVAAVVKMNREIVAAMEKQNELLAAMLNSINTLVAAQRQ